MAVLSTRDDFTARIASLVGDKNDDDTLAIIQDLTETYDSFSGSAGITQEDLDSAVLAKENEWRERYKQAFFSGKPEGLEDKPKRKPSDPDPTDPSDYDDIFKSTKE